MSETIAAEVKEPRGMNARTRIAQYIDQLDAGRKYTSGKSFECRRDFGRAAKIVWNAVEPDDRPYSLLPLTRSLSNRCSFAISQRYMSCTQSGDALWIRSHHPRSLSCVRCTNLVTPRRFVRYTFSAFHRRLYNQAIRLLSAPIPLSSSIRL